MPPSTLTTNLRMPSHPSELLPRTSESSERVRESLSRARAALPPNHPLPLKTPPTPDNGSIDKDVCLLLLHAQRRRILIRRTSCRHRLRDAAGTGSSTPHYAGGTELQRLERRRESVRLRHDQHTIHASADHWLLRRRRTSAALYSSLSMTQQKKILIFLKLRHLSRVFSLIMKVRGVRALRWCLWRVGQGRALSTAAEVRMICVAA